MVVFARTESASNKARKTQALSAFLTEKEVDHLKWVQGLDHQFILGVPFTGQLDYHKCGLGIWYYSFSTNDPAMKTLYQELEAPHIKLHESGASIKTLVMGAEPEVSHALKEARSSHVAFVAALKSMSAGAGKPLPLQNDVAACTFATWYASFKTDDAEIQGELKAIDSAHVKLHESAGTIVALADAGGLIRDSKARILARSLFSSRVEPPGTAFVQEIDALLTLLDTRSQNTEKALEIYRGETLSALTSVQATLLQMRILLGKEAEVSTKALASQIASTKIIIGGCVALALVLGFLIAFFVTRAITRPLSSVVASAQLIAAGDLSQKVQVRSRDEIGDLGRAFNEMTEKLSNVVGTIKDSAMQVSSSSEQITASAQRLAEGAQSQASTLEETSASVEELTASVDQVAEHAQSQAAAVEEGSSSMAQVHQSIEEVSKNLAEIAGLASKSVENALEGARAVTEVVDGISLIAQSSERIGGIVNVISDIADQTNLLALNASIEAARAGEHGRGFAVVADEVSKLADRSSSSTKEIESLIKESVKNVTRGVETAKGSQVAMEQIRAASEKVKEMIGGLSDSMTQQVGAIKELSKALTNVSEMSQSISAATEEQTTNAKQVSKAVESVNDVTQSAASAAEEMSSATLQLSGMAQDLQKMTAHFKIGGDGLKHLAAGGSANGATGAEVRLQLAAAGVDNGGDGSGQS